MPFRIKLGWKIVTRLASPEAVEKLRTGILFNPRGGRGFIRSIGGRIQTDYEPVLLEPTDVFHQSLSKARTVLGLHGDKFPYVMGEFSSGSSNRLNVTVRLFGEFVCLTVTLGEFFITSGENLVHIQDIESHPRISQFVRIAAGIVTCAERNAKPLPSLPKCFPTIQIVSLDEQATLTDLDLVELVTHHPLPRDMVVVDVMQKNQSHLVDQSTLLIDKQGIVSYVPWDAHPTLRGNSQRFENASSMLELAAILKSYLNAHTNLPDNITRIISSSEDAIHESVSAQNTWNLVVKEFKLKTALSKLSSTKIPDTVEKILIVAVTATEVDAILSTFKNATGKAAKSLRIKGYIYQCLGQIGDLEVFLAISEMGSGGTTGSQESIRIAIEAIRPIAALMVGIAFGIDNTKYSIGDILVSKQLLLYDLQRVNSDLTFVLRGDRAPASGEPLNWVRHAIPSWQAGNNAKVEAGLLLSGEKLIDSIDFRDQLAAKVPDALGGEMEGAGLYVACNNSRVPWILIKSICDWADGKKATNKSANQKLAAANASAFVLHVLKLAGSDGT